MDVCDIGYDVRYYADETDGRDNRYGLLGPPNHYLGGEKEVEVGQR